MALLLAEGTLSKASADDCSDALKRTNDATLEEQNNIREYWDLEVVSQRETFTVASGRFRQPPMLRVSPIRS